ncbi:MAG: ABC transporter permease, partial [Armatimonadota bacterium]
MNLVESFRVALYILRTHKLRALLTMLGFIIGVMAVTLVVMMSEGFQFYLSHEFQKLGANTFFVAYDPGGGRGGRRVMGSRIENMTIEDVKYLEERCSKVEVVTGMLQVPGVKVSYLDREVSAP